MTIWTTAEIIDFSFNLWLINCALMRVLRGKRELGLGATPSLRFALEIWRTCSGRELNRGFAGGPGWTFQPAPPSVRRG